MIPVDGFPRGRAGLADSHAALKQSAMDGAANVKGAAAFDGVLSEVSKREAAIDAPSPFDAAAPTPVRGTFSVAAGLISSSDGAGPFPLASVVTDTGVAASRGDDLAKPFVAASRLASRTATPRAEIAPGATASGVSEGLGVAPPDLPIARVPAFPTIATADEKAEPTAADKRSATDAPPPTAGGKSDWNVVGGPPVHAFPGGGSTPHDGVVATRAAPDRLSVSHGGAGARGAGRARPTQQADPARQAGLEQPGGDGAKPAASEPTINPLGGPLAMAPFTQPSSARQTASLAPPTINAAEISGLTKSAATAAASGASPARTRNQIMIGAARIATGLPAGGTPPIQSGAMSASLNLAESSAAESPPSLSNVSTATAERAPVKIAILDRQTHFPPPVQYSPMEQIASRIVTDVGQASGLLDAGAADSSSGAAVQPQPSLAAIRVLHIELEPEGLGAVGVRMRLAGNRLDLQLQTTRADTMRRLADDKDLLVEKLRSAGYATDGLVLSVAGPQTAEMRHGNGVGDNQAQGGHSEAPAPSPGALQEGGAGANEGSGGQRDRSPSRGMGAAEGAEDRGIGHDRRDAVYL